MDVKFFGCTHKINQETWVVYKIENITLSQTLIIFQAKTLNRVNYQNLDW